jgi:hypothetical protein
MNIISHMLSGIIILKIFNLFNPENFSFSTNFILLAMFFSILPDVEGLWTKKELNEHHETPFHTTFFWMTIGFIMLIINFLYDSMTIYIVFLLLVMVLAHLFFDFIFGRFSGIPIFQPFCSRQYSLFSPFNYGGNVKLLPKKFKKDKKKYNEWAKMYFKNRYLIAFEIFIWLIAIFILVFK